MDTVSRRKFLQLTGMGAAGAAATQLSLANIVEAAQTRPMPTGTPILVIVTLYGGNDGLNTLVPYKDPLYYSMRPGISLAAKDVIPLGVDDLALNGTMTGFKTLWDRGQLAIVRGVGYPVPDYSHFSSMAYWQTASPHNFVNSGWIGRWLDTQPDDPFKAIGLGSVLPPLLAGVKNTGSVLPLGGLVVPKGAMAKEFTALGKPSAADSPLQATVAASFGDLLNLSKKIEPVLAKPAPVPDDLPSAIGGSFGADTSLSQQLDVVAKLVAAGAPTKVWSVSLGGFDTHADEVKAQSLLISTVSAAITKFLSQIHASDRANDVTVMVYSEFGRRVRANGTNGTDHGSAGPVFVLGQGVNGGKFYGDEPSLSQLGNDNLAITTDFRDIYGSMLEDVLGTPVGKVIAGRSTKIDGLMLKA